MNTTALDNSDKLDKVVPYTTEIYDGGKKSYSFILSVLIFPRF